MRTQAKRSEKQNLYSNESIQREKISNDQAASFNDLRPEAAKQLKAVNTANCRKSAKNIETLQLKADQYVMQLMKTSDLSDRIKPGPPPTYKVGDKFVKKFSRRDQAEKLNANWLGAYMGGMPTPGFSMEKLEDSNDWVFWSKQVKGDTFFQFSKPGHIETFKAWLDTQPKGRLVELEQIFNGYRVGDPQGFYESKKGGAIEFIDIQKPVGGGAMLEIGQYITRLIDGDSD